MNGDWPPKGPVPRDAHEVTVPYGDSPQDRSSFRSARAGSIMDGTSRKGGVVPPIVTSVEIARTPAEVFTYVTDPTHIGEWQESVVRAQLEGSGPRTVGSRVEVVRRIGRTERTMTSEVTELNPPSSWAVRGTDGPIRGMVKGRVEPLDNGARSRVTIELDFESHGIGKLLVPLVVRRQAQKEMPKNMQNLKARLESSAS